MRKKPIFARVIRINNEKTGVAKHLNKNADLGIFLKKERKNISLQISLEFFSVCRKVNTFIKILKSLP